MNKISVLSYNIHKGFNSGSREFTLLRIRDQIRRLHPDLILIQEIHGQHIGHEEKIVDWPDVPQFEFLAEELWPHHSYGKNAVYQKGDHGNAVLSKYPIVASDNFDLSVNKIERRGLLGATIQCPHLREPLSVFCTHLNVFKKSRNRQLQLVCDHVNSIIDKNAPLILAGDFNDWLESANQFLKDGLNLDEVFENQQGRSAKTFPSALPLLRLDRIYSRGLQLKNAKRLVRKEWRNLSDHLPIFAEFKLGL